VIVTPLLHQLGILALLDPKVDYFSEFLVLHYSSP